MTTNEYRVIVTSAIWIGFADHGDRDGHALRPEEDDRTIREDDVEPERGQDHHHEVASFERTKEPLHREPQTHR